MHIIGLVCPAVLKIVFLPSAHENWSKKQVTGVEIMEIMV